MSETVDGRDDAPMRRTRIPRAPRHRTAADAANAGPPDRGPALAAEPARDDDGEEITRIPRSMRVNRFEIPAHFKRDGWDVQWVVIRVNGEAVDPSELAEYHDGGWRVAKAKHYKGHQGLVPPGTPDDAPVERLGQRLYERPEHLTREALAEAYLEAEELRRDRTQQAVDGMAGAPGANPGEGGNLRGVRGVKPMNLEFSVEGEAGSYGRDPLRRR